MIGKKALLILFVLSLAGSNLYTAQPDDALKKVLSDYIGLYKKETLNEWKELFHPSLMVFFPSDNGEVNVRNLNEFFERQQNYFAKRKSISERLENVQIFQGRRIARIVADFIFIDEGVEKSGKLGLHLVEGPQGWKIVSVVFSYDQIS